MLVWIILMLNEFKLEACLQLLIEIHANPNPVIIAFCCPFGWILKPEEFENGLDVVVSNIKRIPPSSIDSTIKNYHWLDLVIGMFDAYDRGHHTAILTDEENKCFRRSWFNIFSVDEIGLSTPNRGVLEGITRQTVLDLAKELNLPVSLKSLSLHKLISSTEVFATSTAGGIMPITKINGQQIGTGIPGKITRQLHKIYWDKHTDPTWSLAVEDLLQ